MRGGWRRADQDVEAAVGAFAEQRCDLMPDREDRFVEREDLAAGRGKRRLRLREFGLRIDSVRDTIANEGLGVRA